jgi:hypothetical protein
MQLLTHHIIHGWPVTKQHLPNQLQVFWHFREELSIADGLVLKSTRVIVPSSLRAIMLEKIHQSHRGPEYCLRFARDAVFWPGMAKDIEHTCSSCLNCAKYGKQAASEPMLSQPIPTRPWQFVSQDLFELEHNHYLITVDHYSDFYELDYLPNTLATTVIQRTKAHFARHGIPLRCLTDNGPQFISNEYQNFAKTYGFEHATSSPYWPQSNGKAEAAVKDAKSILKKSEDFHLALLNIRNTPPRGHSFSPAQRLMGRRTQSALPTTENLCKPETPDPGIVFREITESRATSKSTYDKRAQPPLPPLRVGSYAYAKPRPTKRGEAWSYGQIINSPTPRSYSINTGSHVLRRNRAQLRAAMAPPRFPYHDRPQPLPPNLSHEHLAPTETTPSPPATSQDQSALPNEDVQQPAASPPPPRTRSGTIVRTPCRFKDYTLY